MSTLTAIDADGHVIEKESEIRKHLKAPWNLRTTPLRPGDQPWDNYMFGRFVTEMTWSKLSAREQVGKWHEILDEHGIEIAVCFPTGSGSVVRLQELQFQIAVARACNDHFAADYNAHSKRIKCVGVLPLRSPQAAAEELERAVKELGITAFEILPVGLPLALGDSFYDPVYAAAERCGAVLGIHGTRSWSRELGAEGLNTFAEVHAYAFTAGILLQFTSMICQGVPVRFPKLRFAFLEIGATWLPYYLDRLDEHWEKRADVEMPRLKEKPSELVRKSDVYFSIEPGESQLPQTLDWSASIILSGHRTFRTGTASSPATWNICAAMQSCPKRSKKRFSTKTPSGCSIYKFSRRVGKRLYKKLSCACFMRKPLSCVLDRRDAPETRPVVTWIPLSNRMTGDFAK